MVNVAPLQTIFSCMPLSNSVRFPPPSSELTASSLMGASALVSLVPFIWTFAKLNSVPNFNTEDQIVKIVIGVYLVVTGAITLQAIAQGVLLMNIYRKITEGERGYSADADFAVSVESSTTQQTSSATVVPAMEMQMMQPAAVPMVAYYTPDASHYTMPTAPQPVYFYTTPMPAPHHQ
jgi:hypothetical protein